MPQKCTICSHQDRGAIEAALAGGISLRTIAKQWSTSKSTLLRHRDKHLSPGPPRRRMGPPSAANTPVLTVSLAPALPQEPPAPLTPEAQQLSDEYRKVRALLEALQVLTEQDWQRWTRRQVRKPQIMLPLWHWYWELKRQADTAEMLPREETR